MKPFVNRVTGHQEAMISTDAHISGAAISQTCKAARASLKETTGGEFRVYGASMRLL